MYKFFVYIILISVTWFAYMNQITYHAAQLQYYKYKYAVNRAAHAATLQLDYTQLAEGYIVIDQERAYLKALDILRQNIGDKHYKLAYFEVVQFESSIPIYHYINHDWDIDLILHQPAVIIVIETNFQHLIKENSIEWEIYGTSQVVNSFK